MRLSTIPRRKPSSQQVLLVSLPRHRAWSILALAATLASPACAFTTLPPNKPNMSLPTASKQAAEFSTTGKDHSELLLQQSLHFVNSWPRQLSPETPEHLQQSLDYEKIDPSTNDNRRKRPVFNGHYVPVQPQGLPDPRLVLLSEAVARDLLHLPDVLWNNNNNDALVQYLAGNLSPTDAWATPYALSIMGQRYTNNCPYGTGNGYGDGRAVSIGEIQVGGDDNNNDNNNNAAAATFELQLKGAGTTPFHRGADGRAVLRSSIREFLASEAMFHLGVSTTRALSLIVSDTLTTRRPWYKSADNALPFGGASTASSSPISMDDPRLAQYSKAERRQIVQQLRFQQKSDPNVMVEEPCAITCRVAPSFTRIGHLDLFARRVEKEQAALSTTVGNADDDDQYIYTKTDTTAWKELEELIWHACYREFRKDAYEPYYKTQDLAAAATVLLEQSAVQIADMVADWIRVGFAQGNFNADNCLVAGRTMDYGPFGWVDEYHPLFAKWTGSGNHFGFLNQPNAGFANYNVLVASVIPVISAATQKTAGELNQQFLPPAAAAFESAVATMFRRKLGQAPDDTVDLWDSLEPLLRQSRVDWTLFWRELTYLVRDYDADDHDVDHFLQVLTRANTAEDSGVFYEPLVDVDLRQEWIEWLQDWKTAVLKNNKNKDDTFEQMRLANPKFVLREWMLVEAYTDAQNDGMEAELGDLYQLIQDPYQEGTPTQIRKYYRKAPLEALTKGGTGFMS